MWNNRCCVPLSHCLRQHHPLTATGLLQISWLRPWSVCLHVSNCDLTDWVHALTSPWRDFPTSIQCTSAMQGEWSDRCGCLSGGFLVSSLLCVIRRQLHPNTMKNPAAADKGNWQAWMSTKSVYLSLSVTENREDCYLNVEGRKDCVGWIVLGHLQFRRVEVIKNFPRVL